MLLVSKPAVWCINNYTIINIVLHLQCILCWTKHVEVRKCEIRAAGWWGSTVNNFCEFFSVMQPVLSWRRIKKSFTILWTSNVGGVSAVCSQPADRKSDRFAQPCCDDDRCLKQWLAMLLSTGRFPMEICNALVSCQKKLGNCSVWNAPPLQDTILLASYSTTKKLIVLMAVGEGGWGSCIAYLIECALYNFTVTKGTT